MKNYIIIILIACMIACAGICRAAAMGQDKPQTEPQIVEIKAEPKRTVAAPPEPQEPQYRYIAECPLSEEVQREIFAICESNGVSFEFVMAVIKKESQYTPDAAGDNCKSKGLMQIQERWHGDLMQELGVTDLYDPVDNVRVGVAILANYFKDDNDPYYVLMKYNGGTAYADRMTAAGKVSDYALEIIETAEKYERENGI